MTMTPRREVPADSATPACAAFRLSSRTQLRGTKSTAVLSNGGSLMRNSDGDEASYGLSTEVGSLSTFISHNWSTTRCEKFMALALYFNFPAMIISMAVSSAVTFGLTVAGVLPNTLLVDEHGNMWSQHTYCPLIAIVGAVLALCVWHDIAARVGAGGRMVFFDKTCIHQSDTELMREGIGSLGAYILRSDEMVAVYSRQYLQKLWTVYELATFLLAHPSRKVRVMPLFLAPMFLGVMTIASTGYIVNGAARSYMMSSLVQQTLGSIITTTILVYMLRRWVVERAAMFEQAKAFSLRSAMCSVEEDRVQVQHNVSTLMKMVRRVEPHASLDTAIDLFDTIVHEELPKVFTANFGRCWSYRHCAAAVACYWLGGVDVLAVQYKAGVPTFTMIMWFLHHMSTTLLILPAVLGLAGVLTSRLTELGQCAEMVWLLFLGGLCAFVHQVLVGLHRAVTRFAIESTVGLITHVGVTCVLVGAVVLLFSCPEARAAAGRTARSCGSCGLLDGLLVQESAEEAMVIGLAAGTTEEESKAAVDTLNEEPSATRQHKSSVALVQVMWQRWRRSSRWAEDPADPNAAEEELRPAVPASVKWRSWWWWGSLLFELTSF